MSTGLIALLDDVAGIAKVAAASLDDVAGQAAKAGAKAAGVVIDDAAVTPRYLVGFAAERELPIVWRIALGSLKNKLVFLLPAALLLASFAPWAITPLLVLGGLFLCYEGAEKVYEAIWPHAAHQHEAKISAAPRDPKVLEEEKISSAIKTDFILSAEIMAISLATLPQSSWWMQALVLAAVGLGITVVVYGAVAMIVKADDVGVALAASEQPVSGLIGRATPGAPDTAADRALRVFSRPFGRGLVRFMPWFLKGLSVLGTAAMIWVGGGIVLHGLEEFGGAAIAHTLHHWAEVAGHAAPPALAGAAEWLANAVISGIVGLALGAALIPLVEHVVAPLAKRLRRPRAAQPGMAPGVAPGVAYAAKSRARTS